MLHSTADSFSDPEFGKSRLRVLADMAIFVEVGRRENFTQAAKALGLPTSTLARRISALEDTLGMLLVRRTTRHQELTEEGRRYFERCQHIVDDAMAVYDDVYARAHGLIGGVRIAAPTEVVGRFLARSVADFLTEHRDIGVTVDPADNDTARDDNFDFLLRLGEIETSPDQKMASRVTRKIGTVPLQLYASPDYLRNMPEIVSRKDLPVHNFLIAETARPYCMPLLRDVPPASVNLGDRFKCETFGFFAALAAGGHGIALLPPEVAESITVSATLTPVLNGWAPAGLPIFVIASSKLLPARVRVFLAFITKRFLAEFNPRREYAPDDPIDAAQSIEGR